MSNGLNSIVGGRSQCAGKSEYFDGSRRPRSTKAGRIFPDPLLPESNRRRAGAKGIFY